MKPRTVLNILGGILLAFIFFITINRFSVYFGRNSPLLPIFITTVITGIALKQKIVDEVFPLIGIGFYLLIGWMILDTDILYGSYTEEYGIVLFAVSIFALGIWVVYFTTIKILRKFLNQAKQRIGEVAINLLQIVVIIYGLYKLIRIKRNLLLGLTGTAAISVHLLMLIFDVEFLPLKLSTFAIASLVALLPFYTRTTQKKSQQAKKEVDIQSGIRGFNNKLPNRSIPRPWRAISMPTFAVPQVSLKQRLPSITTPSVPKPSVSFPSPRVKLRSFFRHCLSVFKDAITKMIKIIIFPFRKLKQILPVSSDGESERL